MDRQRPGEFQACVWRATDPHSFEIYGFPLREPLPGIRIPLRPSDADVLLELQPLIDQVYVTSRFDDIDYHRPLDPPLSDADLQWLDERSPSRPVVAH